MIIITESSNYFKKGQLIENYESNSEGISIKEHFIPNKNFISLNETLSASDEKKVKSLIKKQLQKLFWNLYTKRNVLLSDD